MCTGAEIAVIGIALFGAAKQSESVGIQKKAGKQRRKSARAQQRLAQIQRARERRKAAALASRERAKVRAEAATTGTVGSSAVSGALSSISAQAAERLGFSQVVSETAAEVSGFEAKASRLTAAAATAAAQGQVVSSFGSIFEGSSFSTTPKKEST